MMEAMAWLAPTVPSAVLFDAGGVLAMPDADLLASVIHDAVGVRVEPAQACVAIFRAAAMAARSDDPTGFWRNDGFAGRWAACAGIDAAHAEAAWRAVELADGARRPLLWRVRNPECEPLLGRLGACGVRLAVVSSARGFLRDELRCLGLLHHFDTLVDSALVGLTKPDPAMVRLAMRAWPDVATERCWYVGDDPFFDLEMAATAGIGLPVLYDPLDLHPDSRHLRVRDLRELLPLLDECREAIR
jgi:putative hydrolase of the HAD superfamily